MQVHQHGFTIDTNPDRLDFPFIHQFLSQESYWAKNIPIELVKQSARNALSFGVYHNDKQIGFARVITDKATFAYLGDVFITTAYRGQGLSKWLVQTIHDHPDLQTLRRWMLATADAHSLYARFGFVPITNPERWMQKHNPDIYQPINKQ